MVWSGTDYLTMVLVCGKSGSLTVSKFPLTWLVKIAKGMQCFWIACTYSLMKRIKVAHRDESWATSIAIPGIAARSDDVAPTSQCETSTMIESDTHRGVSRHLRPLKIGVSGNFVRVSHCEPMGGISVLTCHNQSIERRTDLASVRIHLGLACDLWPPRDPRGFRLSDVMMGMSLLREASLGWNMLRFRWT